MEYVSIGGKMNKYLLLFVTGGIVALLGCRPAAAPATSPTATLQAMPQTTPQTTPQNIPQIAPAASPTIASTSPLSPTGEPAITNSTLTIVATIGPTCPGPTRPGQNCTKPYQGDFVVLRSDGSEAAQVSTDANGKATVKLPAGDYTVSVKLQPGTKLPRASQAVVSLSAEQTAEVTIELDTGIR